MNRQELEHVIRVAGEIAHVQELIIMGSQSILGQFPHLSELDSSSDSVVLLRSMEVDLMVPGSDEKLSLLREQSVSYRHFTIRSVIMRKPCLIT